MEDVFIQITLLLVLTVVIAFSVRLFKQPLIIAYIITGMVCGPLFLNLLHGQERMYEVFAQFGVVLLLFIIGLNLNFNHLKNIGKTSLVAGLGQVIFTGIIGTLILLAMKVPLLTSVYLAVAITFSSTIIIMKLLSDKKDTETVYGRYTIGLMLVQDVIAVLIMIALGVFKNAHGDILDSFSLLFFKGIFAVIFVILLSKYVLPKFLDKISDSGELLFIFTVAWCFGVASLLMYFGFSAEIGAIAAGLALSNSPYQPQIASRVKPLRDFFLVLFFIVLGSEMNVASFGEIWQPGLVLSLFILIGNPFILYTLFRLMKFTRRNSFLSGVTAAQVSEFGFVLLFIGAQTGHILGNEIAIFTLVAITTIFISSYLILYNEQLYRFLIPLFNLFGPDKYREQEKEAEGLYDVWVVGYHRIGQNVCETLQKMKKRFAVIDFDPLAIKKLREKNIPSVFGDVADIEFLADLKFCATKMVIMTIPTTDDQLNFLNHLRSARCKALVIANAYHKTDAKILYAAGADYVMMPHLLGGAYVAQMLQKNAWNKKTFSGLKKEQQKMIPESGTLLSHLLN